jgi:hypothetical protein
MSRAGLRWTSDELEQLQALRAKGLDFPTIGAELGRDPKSCEVQLCKLRRRLGIAKVQPPPWNDAEDAKLVKAREVDHKSWKEVAEITGRTVLACIARMDHLRALRGIVKRHKHSSKGMVLPVKVDPLAIASSAAYAMAKNRRDLTASVFGDPPPGYSALDRKRQGLGP